MQPVIQHQMNWHIVLCELGKLCYIETGLHHLWITQVFRIHVDSLK